MSKTFKVGKPIPDPHVAESFYAEITYYFGDADSYGMLEVGPFSHTREGLDELTDLLDTLDNMDKAFPCGRGGGERDNYDTHDVPGFKTWFGDTGSFVDGNYKDSGPNKTGVLIGDPDWTWPNDPYDWETHATPQSWRVYYYDDTLTKNEVAVE